MCWWSGDACRAARKLTHAIQLEAITIMKRRFVTLDVFTDRRFAGNPLAVVLKRRASTARRCRRLRASSIYRKPYSCCRRTMPRIARAIVSSLRSASLPFAGHPTVGTTVLLTCLDSGEELRAPWCLRKISDRFRAKSRQHRIAATRPSRPLPEEAGAPPADDVLAITLGLSFKGDIGFNAFLNQAAGRPESRRFSCR